MNVTSIAYQPQSLGLFQTPATTGGAATNYTQPVLADDAERTHDAATGFAQHLTLRLQQAQGQNGDEQKDTATLASALINAVDYIGEEFGSDAATAAMGIIQSRVGNEEITEDTLGKGLLDVIRFADRNFGFEGGDKLIAHFNGQLNDAINGYFDNGLTEQFYAVTPQTATIAQAVPHILDTVRQEAGDVLADSVADIIGNSLQDGPTMTNLRKGIARAKNHLAQNGQPGAASVLAHAAQDALGTLGPTPAAPPVGTMLDVAV